MAEERVQHGYTVLNRELELPIPPADPKRYLPQIASAAGVHRATERRARELLKRVDEKFVSNGHNPRGAAAGALYLAARERGECLTQDAIAEVSDVSTMTVRQRHRDLETAVTA